MNISGSYCILIFIVLMQILPVINNNNNNNNNDRLTAFDPGQPG